MFTCYNLRDPLFFVKVVRSVAFSESGALVAIGANSRTLRLCSTEPLFQEDSR